MPESIDARGNVRENEYKQHAIDARMTRIAELEAELARLRAVNSDLRDDIASLKAQVRTLVGAAR